MRTPWRWLAILTVISALAGPDALAAGGSKARSKAKKATRTNAAGATRVTVPPRPNAMKRAAPRAAARTPAPRVPPRVTHQRIVTRAPIETAPPSMRRNIGWGTFWTVLGVASAASGNLGGAVIGGAAGGYNFIKAYLVSSRGASMDTARSIAFNTGWGTFWAAAGVHGVITGDPLMTAIGLCAGAYNLVKAGSNYRELPGERELR